MILRLQDAPPQYDIRDQVELRRQIVQALQQVPTQPAVIVLGELTITGGSATSTFSGSDTLSGGTA